MPRIISLLACMGVLAVQLPADTITYIATSASVRNQLGVSLTVNASVPGFVYGGGLSGASPTPFQVGQQVPLDSTFQGPERGALVDFGGIVQQVYRNISGSFNITSSSSFVIPPNPNATYTFAAQAGGQITASPDASGPGLPFPVPPTCDPAVLLIDLPGTLIVQLIGFTPLNPDLFAVTEIFR